MEPKAPQTCGGEAPTARSGFFTAAICGGAAFALSVLTACTTTQTAVVQDNALSLTTQFFTRQAVVPPWVDAPEGFSPAAALDAFTQPGDAAPPDARELARAALTQLGIKYRYGGKAPSTGFDCSGLVVYAAEQSLGLKLPHHAASLAQLGLSVKRTELREGDLVFFNTRGRRFSHMGIYLGENRFVHAPRTGAVVRVERMTAYWQKRYNGARRLDTNTLAALALAQTS